MSTPHSRLTRIEEKLLPFLRAPENPDCELYWAGIPAFPAPAAHRAWLIDFFARLTVELEKQFQIRGELFLQYKTIIEIERRFRQLSFDILPWPGLSRKPGASIPAQPTKEELEAAVRGAPFDVRKYFPDSCFWLRAPHPGAAGGVFWSGRHVDVLSQIRSGDQAARNSRTWRSLKKVFPQARFDKLEEMTKATTSR